MTCLKENSLKQNVPVGVLSHIQVNRQLLLLVIFCSKLALKNILKVIWKCIFPCVQRPKAIALLNKEGGTAALIAKNNIIYLH